MSSYPSTLKEKKKTLNAASTFHKPLPAWAVNNKNWFDSPTNELWDSLKEKQQNLMVLILVESKNISNKLRKMNEYHHEINSACCGNSKSSNRSGTA